MTSDGPSGCVAGFSFFSGEGGGGGGGWMARVYQIASVNCYVILQL